MTRTRKQKKSTNDNPQTSPQHRPSQQLLAKELASPVSRIVQHSTGHNTPVIGLPSTSNPISPTGPSQTSYNAVPPPASLDKRFPIRRPRQPAKHSMTNSTFPPSSQTPSVLDTTILNHIEPSRSLPVLTETSGLQARLSSMMDAGTTSVISVPVRASDYSLEYMQRLRGFAASKPALEAKGYVLRPLSQSEIERKKKCGTCGKAMQKGRADGKGRKKENGPILGAKEEGEADKEDQRSPSMEDSPSLLKGGQMSFTLTTKNIKVSASTSAPVDKPPVIRCRFHSGVVTYHKLWSCCHKHVSSDPCQASEAHLSRVYPPGQLESLWKYHPTPSASSSQQIRPAVAIDCEMGTAKSGDTELIRVTLIDYFSSEILVDKLVFPDVDMEHYNTRFSGVTRRDMERARALGQCVMGRKRAREMVWMFVGPHTVVVGHSADNDLMALRWIHTVVVDTYLVESEKKKAKDEELKAKAKAEAEKTGKEQEVSQAQSPLPHDVGRVEEVQRNKGQPEEKVKDVNKLEETQQDKEKPKKKAKGSGALSLKTLTRERLGREIQTAGRNGHDSLEDAIATRDLAHLNVLYGIHGDGK